MPVWVDRRLSAFQAHRRKAAIEFRFLKAAVRHRVLPTRFIAIHGDPLRSIVHSDSIDATR